MNIFKNRIISLRKLLQNKGLGAFIITIPENRYYLSGFTGKDPDINESAGIIIITQNKLILLTDKRFITQAMNESPNYEVICYKSDLSEKITKILKNLKVKNIAFESAYTTHKLYTKYISSMEKIKLQKIMIPTEGLVESIRIIKSEYEIKQIRKALKIAENSFLKLLSIIKPGMTEKETAWFLEKTMHDLGAEDIAFPTIVASGPNSAMPHARITNRKFSIGEPILFDWGATIKGYCSDTSRTIVLGSPDNKFLNIYNIVLEAQKKAINSIKSGAHTHLIDNLARTHIKKNGYQKQFLHSLGHGTGLAIHEAPKISPFGTKTLKSNMIITIEPGIYIENWGGIRIENQILVCKNGCEILNSKKLVDYKI